MVVVVVVVVVLSTDTPLPKGEKAPPAFAATTMFTQHMAMYSCSPCPTPRAV